jgi:hypothetical protein
LATNERARVLEGWEMDRQGKERMDKDLDRLDRKMALFMGWEIMESNYIPDFKYYAHPDGGNIEIDVTKWHPSRSISQAYELEDKVIEMGLGPRYAAQLLLICCDKKWPTYAAILSIAHASPEQRCRAISKLMEKQDG